MHNYKQQIEEQLKYLLDHAKENGASDHLMFILTAQVSHVKKQVTDAINELDKECDGAIASIDALFDQRKLAKEQVDNAVKDMVSGYLRTSKNGGMPTNDANMVDAVIDNMISLGMFADLFVRFKNS